MQVEVRYSGEQVAFELPDERVVTAWAGPTGISLEAFGDQLREAIEHPTEFPPLRQAVVPGDSVVIPVARGVPALGVVLDALGAVLEASGVDPGAITLLVADEDPITAALPLRAGMRRVVHDPDDRSQLAYLASTAQGRRVYLNRLLTDADVVVPVGRLGFDAELGFSGPWGVIDPLMSDASTRQAFRRQASEASPNRHYERPALQESEEVSWLLGSQFQIGILPGVNGPIGVLAGQGTAVYREGARQIEAVWTCAASEQADLVVAGVGVDWKATTLDDLAHGLAMAARLVRPGGKIVALSRAEGSPGRALWKLAQSEDLGVAPDLLSGLESEPDYPAARSLAATLARADVYLLSRLDPGLVEDLGIIPLAGPADAARLASRSDSCSVLAPADLVQVSG